MQILKQKRLYEGQREQLYQQQFNMEQTRFTVDSIKDTVGTVQALSAANKDMKQAFKKNKELDLNYIDKLQDDMFDMMVSLRRVGALGVLAGWEVWVHGAWTGPWLGRHQQPAWLPLPSLPA